MQDADRAYDEWGMNCGPGAVAAVLGLTLEEVRPHMRDFEKKHYTNPDMMKSVLTDLGVSWLNSKPVDGHSLASYGLVRIQWEGPWTASGAHWTARQRHTHWIGSYLRQDNDVGVFDINCIGNGSGWASFKDWTEIVIPHILSTCEPEADGNWHSTHILEIMP
jgi:hypothetical protein